MSDDKKYTADTAAKMILKKAYDMMLEKRESKLEKGKVMSDMSGGQRKGPEGYGKYQEQAQNMKGINKPVSGTTHFPGGKGTSEAGDYTRSTYGGKPTFSGKDHPAKAVHRKVLAEMKAQPKPNLPKSEAGMGKKEATGEELTAHFKEQSKPKHRAERREVKREKAMKEAGALGRDSGDNLKKARYEEGQGDKAKRIIRANRHDDNASTPRISPVQGIAARAGQMDRAKQEAKGNLETIKKQPKPNLPKAEKCKLKSFMSKKEEKRVKEDTPANLKEMVKEKKYKGNQ